MTDTTIWSRAWILGVVAYAVVRALIAWPTLGQYGVNPVVFLLIDIGTAPPYALGQVRIVQGFRRRDWGRVQLWAAIVLVTFLAPYAYIALAGGDDLPAWVWIVMGILVTVIGTASILRIRRDLRAVDVDET